MPPELLNIFIQVPMVGVVIWLYKQFMDFLREEREIRRADQKEEREIRLSDQKEEREYRRLELERVASTLIKSDEIVASALLTLNVKLAEDVKLIINYYLQSQTEARDHDATMRMALAKMEERTRPQSQTPRKDAQ